MGTGPKKWTEELIAQRVKDGRGQGVGERYLPWLYVQEFSSKGTQTRIPGVKVRRTVHTFSYLERALFLYLEFQDNFLGFHEQSPMDRRITLGAAASLKICHPRYPMTAIPVVMTLDGVVRMRGENGEVRMAGWDVKPARQLLKKRVAEKLSLHKAYCAHVERRDFPVVETQCSAIDLASSSTPKHMAPVQRMRRRNTSKHMESTSANLANTETSTSPFTSHLDEMDKYYAKAREAYPTVPGTEDRTISFRVEFAHDIAPLAALVGWATETWWQSPVCPWGDADVKMTLKPNPLALEELRWLFGQVVDCHVAMEMLELSVNYTGNRRYQDEYELAAVVPTPENLGQAIGGLREYMDCLDNSRERADEALDALEGGADAWGKKVHLQHFSRPDEQATAFITKLQEAGKLASFMAKLGSAGGWPSDSVLPVVARGG